MIAPLSVAVPAVATELPPQVPVPSPTLAPPPIIVGKLAAASSEVNQLDRAGVPRLGGFSGSTEPATATTHPSLSPRSTFSAVATAGPAKDTEGRAPLGQTGFGTSVLATAPETHPRERAQAELRGLEILSKPQPAYTPEARTLRIEGDVQLEILFKTTGEVRVLRLVRGLGHGLDESAIAAAAQIRFRFHPPDGPPVDQSAVVHFIFQLAY